MEHNQKFYKMLFSTVYPLYINKVERKGRTKEELDLVIYWLTGYNEKTLPLQIKTNANFESFFANAPALHPNAHLITGTICGYRVEELINPLTRNVRYLDKLVDELANGKAMDKIMR